MGGICSACCFGKAVEAVSLARRPPCIVPEETRLRQARFEVVQKVVFLTGGRREVGLDFGA